MSDAEGAVGFSAWRDDAVALDAPRATATASEATNERRCARDVLSCGVVNR
jgi:hypothetical protein